MSSVTLSGRNSPPNPAINLNAGFEVFNYIGPSGTMVESNTPLVWTCDNATLTRSLVDGKQAAILTREGAGAFSLKQKLSPGLIEALRGKKITLSISTDTACPGVLSLEGGTVLTASTTGTTNNSAVYSVPQVGTELTLKLEVPDSVSSITLYYFKAEIGGSATPYVPPILSQAIIDCGAYAGTSTRIDLTWTTTNISDIRPVGGDGVYRFICRTTEGASDLNGIPLKDRFILDVSAISEAGDDFYYLQTITYTNGDSYSRAIAADGSNITPWKMGTLITESNTGKVLRFWVGTKAEYDEIVSKDPNTLYDITDLDNPMISAAEIGGAVIGHNHNDRYPTKTQVDVMVGSGGRINYNIAPVPDLRRETLTNLGSPLIWHAAATDGNGGVLFGGGYNGTSTAALVFRYNTDGMREILTSLSTARHELAAAPGGDGSVLFAGGLPGSGGYSADVDKYTASGVRSTLTTLSQARSNLSAAMDGAGNVLFGGGSTASQSNVVDKYDTSGSRTTLTALATARTNMAAACDGSGKVLFGGGLVSSGTHSSAVEAYSSTGVRSNLSNLSQARSFLAAATDGEGNVLFGGGISPVSDVVDRYTPEGIRVTLTPLTAPRYLHAASTDKYGNVLFGGGTNGTTVSYDIVDRYTPDGIKSVLEPLSLARYRMKAAKDGSGNVLFGGGVSNSGDYFSTVDRYTVCPTTQTISVPLGATYKFEEHETEQTATADTIIVDAKNGNSGYVKHSGSVTI